jgi:hypothetical protein
VREIKKAATVPVIIYSYVIFPRKNMLNEPTIISANIVENITDNKTSRGAFIVFSLVIKKLLLFAVKCILQILPYEAVFSSKKRLRPLR